MAISLKSRIAAWTAWIAIASGAAAGSLGLVLVLLYLLPSDDPHGGIFVILPAFVLVVLAPALLLLGFSLRRRSRSWHPPKRA